MSKTTEYIVIGIGIASILFAVFGVIRGGKLLDATSGIIIGTALLGTIFIERNKNNKPKYRSYPLILKT